MKYEFTKDYLTGIEEIDKEHAHLFELVNETYDLMMNEMIPDKYDRIVGLLDELREYTKTHFAHEEAYMESMHYQHVWSQRHQHIAFVRKLEDIDLQALDDSQQEHILEILEFLIRWLQGHIKGADRRIGVAAGKIQ